MDFKRELDALYRQATEHKSSGRVEEAEALEAKAAGILQELQEKAEKDPQSAETAAILLFFADREWSILGDHEKVQARLERAVALLENKLGPDHNLIAQALAKLAEFHFLASRFGEAEPLYRRAVRLYEAYPTSEDPVFAKALEGFAQTLAALGRLEEADGYFAKAIARAGTDGQGKRSLYFMYMSRADGLEKLHKTEEAQVHRQKAANLLPKNNPGESGFHT